MSSVTSLPELTAELLAMQRSDLTVRERLAQTGELFEGYHPEMRQVHDQNGLRLLQILDQHGWPVPGLVGEAASQAARLVLQHAIALPALQRRGLQLLQQAVQSGQVPAWQAAFLDDRIRCAEGLPQLYGTQFDWDENGEISPQPVDDRTAVDQRRAALGLPSLADETAAKRARAKMECENPPSDWRARELERLSWLRSVGWRP